MEAEYVFEDEIEVTEEMLEQAAQNELVEEGEDDGVSD